MPYVALKHGRIHSSKLEYNLVDHCNFSCAECSHFSPYLSPGAQPLEVFRADLERLAQVYRVRRFRFVGGEPLLHRDALSFVRAVRESEIAEKIEIVTNGVLLGKAPDSLLEEIDLLTVSWYPDPRVDVATLRRVRNRLRNAGLQCRVERIDSFRRMQSPRNDDSEQVRKIFDSCLIAHSWYCQTFYDGYFYLCSRPIYTAEFLSRVGEPTVDFRRQDGIPLHEPRLLDRIIALLQRDQPLAACRYCLGTVGKRQPWRQLSATERRNPPGPGVQPAQNISVRRLNGLLMWRNAQAKLLRVLPSASVARMLNAALTLIMRD